MWLQPLELSEAQQAFLVALGRATALAQNFEQNCKFVFGILDLNQAYEDGTITTSQERRARAKAVMERMLGPILTQIRENDRFTDEEVATLDAARLARNYLAHEAVKGALLTPPRHGRRKLKEILLGSPDPQLMRKEQLDMALEQVRGVAIPFRERVRALAEGDRLVARWSFLIQERDTHLPFIDRSYVEMLCAWICEPLDAVHVA